MNIQERSGVHVLHPKGELTIFEAAEFREALLALDKHEDPIELDLSDVERVDSSGIQLVMAALQSNRISLKGMTPSVAEKFGSIGCAYVLNDTE